MGVRQILADSDYSIEMFSRALEDSKEYLRTTKMKQTIRDKCKNEHSECAVWAMRGECDVNPRKSIFARMRAYAACLLPFMLYEQT